MIRCIAIDDEPLALKQLERFISRIPELELLGAYYSVEAAKEAIATQAIDVIFLDIEMPDVNGLDFAQQLDAELPYIIFTTAYPQYAVEGFRLDAVDYLLKPLSFDELVAAVDKVKRRQLCLSEQAKKRELYIKASGQTHKVAVSDILYIKGLSEYVQIWLRGAKKPLTTFASLKHFEEELSQLPFMRLHKSFLVNLDAIERTSSGDVTIGDTTIPIGKKYRADFLKHLAKTII